jgi:GPH family glycoside/pentoside/hexuronide:cation symporter
MISVHLMYFCTDVILMSSQVVGFIMAIAQVWDAITDPALGYLSDRTPWKWGRRRPFIAIGAPLTALCFFLIFSPPEKFAGTALAFYFGIVVLLFFAFRTVWETPYFALAPELTLNYDERTRLSGYQQYFATIGDIIGSMAPLVLIGLFLTERHGFSSLGLLVAVLAVGSAAFTYFGTRENPALSKKSTLSLLKSLVATLGNRPYLMLVLASTCTAISNYTTIQVIRYIIKYYFEKENLAAYFFIAFFIGVFISIPIWIKLITRIGKKNAYIFTMLTYSVILCLILLLRQSDYLIFGAAMIIAGAFNIALWLIAGAIVPDIIEWDQLRVGERREGAYYGIWTLIRKAGIGGAFFVVGTGLNLVGYQPDVTQTPQALLGIKLLFGPIPAVFLIIGALVFLKFPITKEVHEDILRQLEEKQKTEK